MYVQAAVEELIFSHFIFLTSIPKRCIRPVSSGILGMQLYIHKEDVIIIISSDLTVVDEKDKRPCCCRVLSAEALRMLIVGKFPWDASRCFCAIPW